MIGFRLWSGGCLLRGRCGDRRGMVGHGTVHLGLIETVAYRNFFTYLLRAAGGENRGSKNFLFARPLRLSPEDGRMRGYGRENNFDGLQMEVINGQTLEALKNAENREEKPLRLGEELTVFAIGANRENEYAISTAWDSEITH